MAILGLSRKKQIEKTVFFRLIWKNINVIIYVVCMEKNERKQTCSEPRVFYEDLAIARALINRDKKVTLQFYFKGCYPIFQCLFRRFDTDCESPIELMNQVYMMILYPSKKTGRCQLENYKGESTLRKWINSVAIYYCYGVYNEKVIKLEENIEDGSDRFDEKKTLIKIKRVTNEEISDIEKFGSVEMNTTNMVKDDIISLIALMPNKRYAEVIRLFLIEGYSNAEVADTLGMSMANLYNLKLRAETQFELVCRKEERYV